MYVNHNINVANEGCDAKMCAEPPIVPIHEVLEKLTALSDDIRGHANYIDSTLFPSRDQVPFDARPDDVLNIYDHLRKIGQTLSVANDVLMRVRDRL